jgi:hypothetical protein
MTNAPLSHQICMWPCPNVSPAFHPLLASHVVSETMSSSRATSASLAFTLERPRCNSTSRSSFSAFPCYRSCAQVFLLPSSGPGRLGLQVDSPFKFFPSSLQQCKRKELLKRAPKKTVTTRDTKEKKMMMMMMPVMIQF